MYFINIFLFYLISLLRNKFPISTAQRQLRNQEKPKLQRREGVHTLTQGPARRINSDCLPTDCLRPVLLVSPTRLLQPQQLDAFQY